MAKTVFITGASSGIGRETALHFLGKGWKVAATMRRPEDRSTGLEGKGIELLHLDVTDPASVRAAFQAAAGKLGGPDVVVNNAGYAVRGAFEASGPEDARRQFETNVLGLMNVAREAIPLMRERGEGVLVNLASIGGRAGFPFYSVYNATKFAVEGFSEALQYELEPFHVRVKVIEPGVIRTDFYERSMVEAGLECREAYAAHLTHSIRRMAASEARGSHPRVIAALIYRAATDGSRRLRYHGGSGASPVLVLRRILPDRLFFPLLKRFSM